MQHTRALHDFMTLLTQQIHRARSTNISCYGDGREEAAGCRGLPFVATSTSHGEDVTRPTPQAVCDIACTADTCGRVAGPGDTCGRVAVPGDTCGRVAVPTLRKQAANKWLSVYVASPTYYDGDYRCRRARAAKCRVPAVVVSHTPSGQQEMRSPESWPRQMNRHAADVSQVGGARLLSRKRKADVSGGGMAMEVLPELSCKVFVKTVCPPPPRQHLRDNSPTPPTRHATGFKEKPQRPKQAAFHATLSSQPNNHAPSQTDMSSTCLLATPRAIHVTAHSRLPQAGVQACQYRGPEHYREQGSLSEVPSSWSDTQVGVQRPSQAAVTRPLRQDLVKMEEPVRGDGACEEYHPQASRSQHQHHGYQSSIDDLPVYGPAILLTQNNNSLPAGRYVSPRGQGRRQRNCREVLTNMNFSQQLDGEYVFEYNYRRRRLYQPQQSPSYTHNRLKNYAGERFCNKYDPKQNSVSVSNQSDHVIGKCLDFECLRRRGEALHNDIIRSLNLLNKAWATGGSREGTDVATTSGNDGAKGQGAGQQTVMAQPEEVTVSQTSQTSQVSGRTGRDDGRELPFDKRPDGNASCKYSRYHRRAPQIQTSTPDVSQVRASGRGGSVRHLTGEEKITKSSTANKDCLDKRQGQTDGSQPSKGRQQEVAGHQGTLYSPNISNLSSHDALLTRQLLSRHTTATRYHGFQNQTASANQAREKCEEMRSQLAGDSKAAPDTLPSKAGAAATKATHLSSPFRSNATKYPTSQSNSPAFRASGGDKSLSVSNFVALCNSDLSKSSIRGSSAMSESLAGFPLHRNRSPPCRGSSVTSNPLGYTANKTSFPYIAATSPLATVSRPGSTKPPRVLAASSIKAPVSSELNRKQSSSSGSMISHVMNVRKTSSSNLTGKHLTVCPTTPISALSIDSGTNQPPGSTRTQPSLPVKTALSSVSTVDGPFRFSNCSESSLHCVDSSSATVPHDPTSSVTLTRTTSPGTAMRTALHSTSLGTPTRIASRDRTLPGTPARSVVSGPASPQSLPRTVSRDLTSPEKRSSTTSRDSTSPKIAMSVSGHRSSKISPNTILPHPISQRTPTKTASRGRTSSRISTRTAVVTNPSNTTPLVTSTDELSPSHGRAPGASLISKEHVKSRGGEECDLSTVDYQDAVPSDSNESQTCSDSNKPRTFSSSLLEPVTFDLSTSRQSDPLFPATPVSQDQCIGIMSNQDQGRSRTGLSTDSSVWGSTSGGSTEMVVRQPDQERCYRSAEHARGDNTALSAGHKWAPCPGSWGTWGTLRRLLVLALPLVFLLGSLTGRPCAMTGEPFLRLERIMDDVLAHLSLHHVAPPAL